MKAANEKSYKEQKQLKEAGIVIYNAVMTMSSPEDLFKRFRTYPEFWHERWPLHQTVKQHTFREENPFL